MPTNRTTTYWPIIHSYADSTILVKISQYRSRNIISSSLLFSSWMNSRSRLTFRPLLSLQLLWSMNHKFDLCKLYFSVLASKQTTWNLRRNYDNESHQEDVHNQLRQVVCCKKTKRVLFKLNQTFQWTFKDVLTFYILQEKKKHTKTRKPVYLIALRHACIFSIEKHV